MASKVAQNVKSIIRKRRLLQVAVAEKAGYPYAKFNRMLNGRKCITDEDIVKLALALDVTPNELFGFPKAS